MHFIKYNRGEIFGNLFQAFIDVIYDLLKLERGPYLDSENEKNV